MLSFDLLSASKIDSPIPSAQVNLLSVFISSMVFSIFLLDAVDFSAEFSVSPGIIVIVLESDWLK